MAAVRGFSTVSTALAAHLAAGWPAQAGGVASPKIVHAWQDIATAPADEDRLLLLLFHVEPDQSARAASRPVRDSGGRAGNTTAVWQLCYLVVPAAGDALRAQDLLQQAAMHLHHNPVIASAYFSDQVLAVKPQAGSQEQMNAIWAGIKQPLRPSLVYCVTVMLESAQDRRTSEHVDTVTRRYP